VKTNYKHGQRHETQQARQARQPDESSCPGVKLTATAVPWSPVDNRMHVRRAPSPLACRDPPSAAGTDPTPMNKACLTCGVVSTGTSPAAPTAPEPRTDDANRPSQQQLADPHGSNDDGPGPSGNGAAAAATGAPAGTQPHTTQPTSPQITWTRSHRPETRPDHSKCSADDATQPRERQHEPVIG